MLTRESYVFFEHPEAVRNHCEAWSFGKVTLLRSQASNLRVVRTARHVDADPAPILALTLHQRGNGHYEQYGSRIVGTPDRIVPLDLNTPYRIRWGGECHALTLQLRLESLCLSAETIRLAAPCLPISPMHALVMKHLVGLHDSVQDTTSIPARTTLGDATTELVRALLLSAAQTGADAAALPDAVLLTQVRRYVLEHLTDPELSPERIARAQHISLRSLYKAWGRGELSLEQWIIGQRLERARGELAHPEIGNRSIATIARICGFRDPSHFTRRFRAAYGMSPSEWRRAVLGQPSP